MSLVIDLHEAGQRHVGITLRCGQARMSEQLLHGSEVRATFQQVGSEGMTQHMR